MDERSGRRRPRELAHPELLLSFANVASHPRPSCLLRVNIATQHGEWIDVGLGELLASGVGICADDRYLYHVLVANSDFSTYVSVLDRQSLQVVNVQRLPEIDDGHSVVRLEDELIVVSSGTDQIFAYPLDGFELGPSRILWSPTDSGRDTHHVNSLTNVDGELICSAFGPKENDSWASAESGYVYNVTTGQLVLDGLRQPHSVTWHGEELFFCNSREGTVNTREAVVAYLYGYSRGLSFGPDGVMYVGTSVSRRPVQAADDAVVFLNPGDTGDLHGQCAVIQMNEMGTNRLEMAMAPFGNEIYDIFVL